MKVEFLKRCEENGVDAQPGDIQTHNRDKGKWLVRQGYAVETDKATDEQRAIAAATEEEEQPQHYETLYYHEPECKQVQTRTWWQKLKSLWHRQPE